jgi:BlaI family transcriptional regulator, penicillinase repressor
VWAARATRTRTASDLVRKVLDHVFDGSAGRLVAHLLEDTELDARDRDEIRKLLEAFDAREIGHQGEKPP